MQHDANGVLQRFRQGDADAFETLFRLHQRMVFLWALRIVRDRGAAEDVTIEAFWRMHQAHARFDCSRGFEPWARRIVTHSAIDWLRRQKPEAHVEQAILQAVAGPPEADAAITAEIRDKMARALQRLAPKLRITATLAVIEDRPYKEVADALGISVTAVKLRVFRALRLLRSDLQRQGITP